MISWETAFKNIIQENTFKEIFLRPQKPSLSITVTLNRTDGFIIILGHLDMLMMLNEGEKINY